MNLIRNLYAKFQAWRAWSKVRKAILENAKQTSTPAKMEAYRMQIQGRRKLNRIRIERVRSYIKTEQKIPEQMEGWMLADLLPPVERFPPTLRQRQEAFSERLEPFSARHWASFTDEELVEIISLSESSLND